MSIIEKHFDKAYEQMGFKELADAPVASIEGVSEKDAQLLAEAFGIKTVRDLGTNKYFRVAAAVVAMADFK